MAVQAEPEASERVDPVEPEGVEGRHRADGRVEIEAVQNDQMSVACAGGVGQVLAVLGVFSLGGQEVREEPGPGERYLRRGADMENGAVSFGRPEYRLFETGEAGPSREIASPNGSG